MRPGADGLHEFAGVTLTPPAQGVFIRGRIHSMVEPYQVKYGIEAWFAPKDQALQLERDLRNGGVAILMVSDHGRVALQDIVPAVGD